MTKCAFKNCPNKSSPGIHSIQKPGLYFYSFKDVPPAISEQWIRIVGRERCSPNFRPAPTSLICSEHFAPYDISPSKKLSNTAIPSINIGPYDDAVIIPDDERYISKESDIVCIIENQIQTQPSIEGEDVVCVIENQISTESQTSDEQDIDIEEQIQWSLVGTSKHFEGLLHTKDPVSNLKSPTPPPPPVTIKEEKKKYLDEDVMIIEEETEHGKNDTENERGNNVLHYENEKEFKDQYSEFLKTYDTSKLINRNRNIRCRRNKIDNDNVRQHIKTSLKSTSKHFAPITHTTYTNNNPLIPINSTQNVAIITQPVHTAPRQFATTMQQSTNFLTIHPIPLAPQQCVKPSPSQYVITTQQTIPTTPKQFETTTQQRILIDPKQFITTTRQTMKPINKFETTSRQLLPIQLAKTIPFTTTPHMMTTPQIATTPQFVTLPEITTQVLPTEKQPIAAYQTTNYSDSGLQLYTVCVEQDNDKTYYLSNVLPSYTKLKTESDPIGEDIVTPQCLTLNDNTPETNFLNRCSKDSEKFQPVIVKTENISDF